MPATEPVRQPSPPRWTVNQIATGWAAVAGDRVLGEFATNAAAWRWIDRQERRALWVNRDTAEWTGKGVCHCAPDKD